MRRNNARNLTNRNHLSVHYELILKKTNDNLLKKKGNEQRLYT